MLVKNLGCRPVALKKFRLFCRYNLRISYIFKGNFGSSVRFSERTEYFPEHQDPGKLKTKFTLSLYFREKDKIKEIKQKG